MNEQGDREFIPLNPKAREDVNEALEVGGAGNLLGPDVIRDIDEALRKGGAGYLVDLYRDGKLRHPLTRLADAIYNILAYPLIPDSTTRPQGKGWGFLEKPSADITSLWELFKRKEET